MSAMAPPLSSTTFILASCCNKANNLSQCALTSLDRNHNGPLSYENRLQTGKIMSRDNHVQVEDVTHVQIM